MVDPSWLKSVLKRTEAPATKVLSHGKLEDVHHYNFSRRQVAGTCQIMPPRACKASAWLLAKPRKHANTQQVESG